MPYKKYTPDERANFVAYLLLNGYPNKPGSLRFTQRKTGVDKGQLRRWLDFPDKWCGSFENIEEKMNNLGVIIDKELEEIFEQMKGKREGATYSQLATAAGILLDKMLVLQNKPTSINENRGVVDWMSAIKADRDKYNPVEEKN